MSRAALFQLEGVRRVIPRDKVILDIDSLCLAQGELTAIVGPNGAGKSTLLKILAFLDRPDRGTVHFQGKPIGPEEFSGLRRKVTLVDQAPLLFSGTVMMNVAYGLKVRGVRKEKRAERVSEALARVDLAGFETRSAQGLSGGETQRVAIARALVFHPEVLLLDEPTAGVDAARVEMVEKLITELHTSNGTSILFSTHDLNQAHRLTNRVIHLAEGKVVPEGGES
jgi:tungstate transport system ATP-binding protein